ncbi:hypothetical protein M413DRAFT_413029, partial [Hebeloma cylindrosporum]
MSVHAYPLPAVPPPPGVGGLEPTPGNVATQGPAPAIDPTVPPAGNVANKPRVQLKDAEIKMIIAGGWTDSYRAAKNKPARQALLAENILPQLRTVNTELTDAVWKLRKSQIKLWFQNEKRKDSARARFTMTRKPSLKQVACHVYKTQIAAIAATRANGARAGTTGYLPVFQGAVNSFIETLNPKQLAELETEKRNWEVKGHPDEMKQKAAENNGLTYLRTCAETQFREMGMRSITWECHKNKAGDTLVQMHDFNREIGGLIIARFEDRHPAVVVAFEDAFMEHMRYIQEVATGAVVEDISK